MDYANGGSGTYWGAKEDRPVNDSRVPPDEEKTTTNNDYLGRLVENKEIGLLEYWKRLDWKSFFLEAGTSFKNDVGSAFLDTKDYIIQYYEDNGVTGIAASVFGMLSPVTIQEVTFVDPVTGELIMGEMVCPHFPFLIPGLTGNSIFTASKVTIPANVAEIAPRVSQKQLRHIAGRPEYRGGGVLNSVDDAQAVLDAYRSGNTTILGTNSQGFPVIRFDGVTGTNINLGAGITGQSTNIFMIKGTSSPSIVPISPGWKP